MVTPVTKMKILILRTAVLVFLASSHFALATEPWEGTYRWDNEAQQNKPGNVTKYVNLRVAVEQDGKVILSCEVFWKPGMDADFGAVVEQTALIDRTLPDGTIAKVIPFAFEDGNENKGTGEVEIQGSIARVRIVNTEINFPEAARQYGAYQLQKQSP